MVRVSMHGVRIDYSADALPSDPLGSFFAPFPRDEASGPPDLRIVLRPARAAAGVDAASALSSHDGLQPFFFHGSVQVYRAPSGLVVSSGAARAEISPDASEIVAVVPVAGEEIAETTEGVLHVALLWALRARSLFDLHAAAVVPSGSDARAIVIAGDSGSGKTTLTLALLEAGFGYLGDDRVLLRQDADIEVLPYPRAFHVGAATLCAFPQLGRLAAPRPRDEKRSVDPALAYPSKLHAGRTRPSLLLLPRVVDRTATTVRPVSQADAFGHLLHSSAILAVEGMPHRMEHLACLRELASRVPAFEVLAGRDVLESPVEVAASLEPIHRTREGG